MSGGAERKVLALFHDIPRPPFEELKRLEETDQTPRATIFATEFNADVLDRRMLERAPAWRRFVYRFLPVPIAQVLEAFAIYRRYDFVLSWHEKLGFTFALLCKLTGAKRVPHVALCSWPAKGVKGVLMRLVQSRIDRYILWSTVQRDLAIRRFRVSPWKISLIHYFVDEKFFRPLPMETDMILSVGSEMRDFPTLIAALDGLDIRCHVAAGVLSGERTQWIKRVEEIQNLPPNVSVGKKSHVELRALYARSRFVIIPLLPTDTDNGTTCMLEAMAMGKPVICSRTEGQVDVMEDGVTGLFVPVGDVKALREAILYLWNNVELAERMGRAGRAYIERVQRLDKFVGDIKAIVEEVFAARNGKAALHRPVALDTTATRSMLQPDDALKVKNPRTE
ncbi:MAG: hypothetical protein C4326_06305 [Ignavibacteria bacterium]